MTHTSTEQPEALRLAEFFESMRKSSHRWYDGTPVHEKAAAELRRLHARVQELEASQAQRKPLTDAQAKEAIWIEHLRWMDAAGLDTEGMRPTGDWLDHFLKYVRAIERAHGITQEKQG